MQNLMNIHFRQQGDETSKKTEMRKIEKFSGVQKNIFSLSLKGCPLDSSLDSSLDTLLDALLDTLQTQSISCMKKRFKPQDIVI